MPRLCFLLLLAFSAFVTSLVGRPTLAKEPAYTADWKSLSAHQSAPEWFADSKLGIYFHWGVYAVPAHSSEWYPHHMHLKGHKVAKHHLEKYGHPSKFGYHDFVPQFTAEKFDPADWAELFKTAGARFAGPVAQHHDGFAMWDSEVNPWNVADRGPKRDITGELTPELRERGMKLITTFHHARHLQRNAEDPANWEGMDSHYSWNPDFPTSSSDPLLSKLYGNMPAEEFNDYWLGQINEVVDNYSPDIIWFDSWLNLIPEEVRQEMCAHYLNHAAEKGQEVVLAYKQTDLPASVGVLDIEQGGKKDLSESVWLTDVTLSYQSWCYTEGQTYKPAELVIRNMIDVWSKNGVVLLNISPKADGSIPDEQRTVLKDIGAWMTKYGEAVYDTRPFDIYGFGNAKADDGHFGGQSATVKYTANDIRFTQSKDGKSLYLFFLGEPKAGQKFSFSKMGPHHYPPNSAIKRISVLGTDDAEVEWKMQPGTLDLTLPEVEMDEIATILKFELE